MFVFNSKNDTKQDNAHKTKRYHATRPGGQWNKGGGGVGWDSSQPFFGSYPIPIPTGGRGRLCPSWKEVPIKFLSVPPCLAEWLRNRILCENLFTYYEWQAGASPQKSKAEFSALLVYVTKTWMNENYVAATLSHFKEKIKTAHKCNLCQQVSR